MIYCPTAHLAWHSLSVQIRVRGDSVFACAFLNFIHPVKPEQWSAQSIILKWGPPSKGKIRVAASLPPVWWFVGWVHPEVDGVLCFDTSATEICKMKYFVGKLLASVTASCKTEPFSRRRHDLHTHPLSTVVLSGEPATWYRSGPRSKTRSQNNKSHPAGCPGDWRRWLNDPRMWRVFVLSMRLSSFRALMCACVFGSFTPPKPLTS